MPLWTIFTKWPAPFGPQCSQPRSAVDGSAPAAARVGVRGGRLDAGGEGVEDRRQPVDGVVGAADHQAVAALEAVRRRRSCRRRRSRCRGRRRAAAARSTSSWYHELPPSMIVSPRREQRGQRGDRRVDERRRHHDPDVARRRRACRRTPRATSAPAMPSRRRARRRRRRRRRSRRTRGRRARGGGPCWRPSGRGRSCRAAWRQAWHVACRRGRARGGSVRSPASTASHRGLEAMLDDLLADGELDVAAPSRLPGLDGRPRADPPRPQRRQHDAGARAAERGETVERYAGGVDRPRRRDRRRRGASGRRAGRRRRAPPTRASMPRSPPTRAGTGTAGSRRAA